MKRRAEALLWRGDDVLWVRRLVDERARVSVHALPGADRAGVDGALTHDGGPEVEARVAALRGLFTETGLLWANGAERLDQGARGRLREALQDGDRTEATAAWRAAGVQLRTASLLDLGRHVSAAWPDAPADRRVFALPAGALEGAPDPDRLAVEDARLEPVAALWERHAAGAALLSPTLRVAVDALRAGHALRGALAAGTPDRPSQRWEVAPHVWRRPYRTPTLPPATRTNVYLVGSGEALLVEPAPPGPEEQAALLAWVEEAAAAGLRVAAIVPTHHHIDHVGATAFLAERLDAPVWAHAETARRMPKGVVVDRHLEDGDEIRLDGPTPLTVRCLFTPGHAPGHLCLLEARSGVLLCGDMVASIGTILIEPQDGDMALYLDSLARLRTLGPSMLLPAHGLPLLAPAAVLDHYRAHRLAREAKVLAALRGREGPSDAAALVPVAYDDAPQAVWPLAALSTEAHLRKLARDGLAQRGESGWAAVG